MKRKGQLQRRFDMMSWWFVGDGLHVDDSHDTKATLNYRKVTMLILFFFRVLLFLITNDCTDDYLAITLPGTNDRLCHA